MATADATLYSASIAIIIASIYVFKNIQIDEFWRKLLSYFPTWLGGRTAKLDLEHLDERPSAAPQEESIASKYSSNWWSGEKQFQLERRAIFSRTWLYVTHISRFQKPGDYRTFEILGFSFVVILGKGKQLRAFHNVCRHRAYAVTKKESGSSTVLGCRYHGWSYDTQGKLIKAPEFEDIAGFDKAMNGLWELKTEVRNGMFFVNFEVGNGKAELNLGEAEKTLKKWKIGEMKWAHEWKVEGAFNWKLAAGNFSTGIQRKANASRWQSFLPSILQASQSEINVSHTAFAGRLLSGQILIVKIAPISTMETWVECNIIGRNLRQTKATKLELDTLKREIQMTVQRLEHEQQDVVNGGREVTNLSIQEEIGQILGSHAEGERRAGAEIHPAARKQSFTAEGIADDDLCKELEMGSGGQATACGANAKGQLDW